VEVEATACSTYGSPATRSFSFLDDDDDDENIVDFRRPATEVDFHGFSRSKTRDRDEEVEAEGSNPGLEVDVLSWSCILDPLPLPLIRSRGGGIVPAEEDDSMLVLSLWNGTGIVVLVIDSSQLMVYLVALVIGSI
jgi:hypothetical protein